MLDKLKDRLVDDLNCALRWFTTWLNIIGTTVVTYVLSNDQLVAQLIPVLPAHWRPYAPVLGVAWGALVQVARMVRQKPKAVPNG